MQQMLWDTCCVFLGLLLLLRVCTGCSVQSRLSGMIHLPPDSVCVPQAQGLLLSDSTSARVTWMSSWRRGEHSPCVSGHMSKWEPFAFLRHLQAWWLGRREPNWMTQTLISPTPHIQRLQAATVAGRAQPVPTRSPCNGLRRAGRDEPDDECGARESIILKGEHVNSSFCVQLAWQKLDIILARISHQ